LDARATEGMAEGSYQYVWNDTTFRDIDPEQTDYVLGNMMSIWFDMTCFDKKVIKETIL